MKAINKDILKLAIPSILANITVPLVGMVDIAVLLEPGLCHGSPQRGHPVCLRKDGNRPDYG